MRKLPTGDWDYVGWHYKAIHAVAPLLHNRPWIRAKGLENLPPEEGFLYAGNHWSWWDPIVLQTTAPRPVNWLAKKEMMNNAFNRWFFFDRGGCIPVDRDRRNPEAYKAAVKALNEGRIVGIFPQGTRRMDVDPSKVKTGVARLALEAGAPVVPVGILTDEFWPPERKVPDLTKRVWLNVGKPLRLKGDPASAEDARAGTDVVMSEISRLLDEARDARERGADWKAP